MLLPYGWDEARRVTEVVAVVGVARRGQELQPAPAALLGEGKDARQRRLGDDGKVDALADVPRGTVETIEEVRAARTRPLPLRSEHEAVDRKRILAGCKQLRQPHALRFAARARRLENIVLRDFAARRQCSTLGRHALDLAAQLHLLLKQDIARPAILRALIGKVNVLNGLRSGFCE